MSKKRCVSVRPETLVSKMCQAVCPRLKSFERDELIRQEGRDEMQAEVAEAQAEIIRVKAEADEARARTKMLLLEKDRGQQGRFRCNRRCCPC